MIEEKNQKNSVEKNLSMREIAAKCDRFCDTESGNTTQSTSDSQTVPNSSFLWKKSSKQSPKSNPSNQDQVEMQLGLVEMNPNHSRIRVQRQYKAYESFLT